MYTPTHEQRTFAAFHFGRPCFEATISLATVGLGKGGWSCRQAYYVGRIKCGVTVHTNKNTQMHEPICDVAVPSLQMLLPSLHPWWMALLTEPSGWWVREGVRHIGMVGAGGL